MYVTDGSSHRLGVYQADEAAAMEVEDGRTSCVHSHEDNYSRRREQQACRDYWVSMYGADAELASRGGVTWID